MQHDTIVGQRPDATSLDANGGSAKEKSAWPVLDILFFSLALAPAVSFNDNGFERTSVRRTIRIPTLVRSWV